MTNIYSRIAGTGSSLPDKVLTNQDLEKMVDTTDEWIRTRTGIERRHIAAENETNLDFCERAARNAMQAASVGPEDIDLVIVGTTTPDLVFPNMGCLLQQRIGIHGCPAFSLEAACAGFIYALNIGDKFVRSGSAKCALIVGGETLSRMTDYTDRGTCILFGDGAGAVVLQPYDQPGIISTHLHADGKYADLLYFPSGVSRKPQDFLARRDFIRMKGNEVFKIAVHKLGDIVVEALKANNMPSEQLDWLVPHQANLRIIEATARKLKMPMERVVLTIQEHGNTSTASVPLALDVAVRDGRIKRGQTILLEAFGGGFTWGAALIRY
ncbi:MAG: ketoacyl-ACP synthase III [Gammaproteobacteria bacterium]|nr:ketoacyl-ACP synthase III [Gammaproteobacteria bacterium]